MEAHTFQFSLVRQDLEWGSTMTQPPCPGDKSSMMLRKFDSDGEVTASLVKPKRWEKVCVARELQSSTC